MTHTKKTTDLVVRHAAHHTAARELIDHAGDAAAPLLFAVSGVATIAMALTIVRTAETPEAVFMAQNATDYAAQQAFYAGSELHAAAGDATTAAENLHAAAEAKTWSRQLMSVGMALFVGTFAWAGHVFGWWAAPATFTVRKIK